MKIINYPARNEWPALTVRPKKDLTQLRQTVETVLADVRQHGDEAVKRYELMFDKVRLDDLQVSEAEMLEAEECVSDELKAALAQAHHNITAFHEAQRYEGKRIETAPGVVCWQKAVAMERVGLYVPGGTAPLFSTVLMLATPARIAGCQEVVLCSPPGRDGRLHPAILVAARMAGVKHIYKIGGVQAIGAMAYGTESVPKVDKIFGPGNQYVMAAKQTVSLGDVAIDMPAGPSEVAVVADETSNPVFVAADLLSQAEHGVDSQVLLVGWNKDMLTKIMAEVERQLPLLPRCDMAQASLDNSRVVLVHDADEAIDLVNVYAPEHLILSIDRAAALAERVRHAGSVFLGHYSCESAGDYASGTNHTLPTSGYARAYSGVSLDSFIRKITFQELSAEGIRSIGHTVELMAENEQLLAHKRAMSVRLAQLS